jgi:hypothetical protein
MSPSSTGLITTKGKMHCSLRVAASGVEGLEKQPETFSASLLLGAFKEFSRLIDAQPQKRRMNVHAGQLVS